MALRGLINVIVTLIGSLIPFLAFFANDHLFTSHSHHQHLGLAALRPIDRLSTKYLYHAQEVSRSFTNCTALVRMIQHNSN